MKLEICLLGTPSIALEGRRLEFSRRKTEAILYYLAGKGVDISASTAANLLWPEYAPDRARASLRRTLCDATAVGGRRLIERRGRCIGFAADLEIDCDARLFMALSSRGLADGDILSLGQAASIYRGEYLEGFYLDDALVFEDWQLLESENFKNRATEVFMRLAQACLGSGSLDEAEAWGRRLAAIDPLAPAGHRLLMEIAAARGNAPEALKDYEVYARILERELGARPDPELEALKERIRAGERGSRQAKPIIVPEEARHPPLREPAQRDVDMGTWLVDRTVSAAGYLAARSFFSSALERQADQPDALLGLSICDFGEIFLGISPPSAFSGIQERLLRGRDLYPRHAGLRAFDGFIRCVRDWEWKAARELLEGAWEERRGDPGVANWYANYLSSAGRLEEALRVAEEALAQAPASRIMSFSVALRLHYLGRDREALALCDRLIARQPDYWLAYEAKGLCQLSLGLPDLAAESFREAIPDGGCQAHVFRSCALALLGLGPDARKELELAERGQGKGRASQFFRALALSYLGERERAAAAMDRAFEERDFRLAFLRGLPIGKILPERGLGEG